MWGVTAFFSSATTPVLLDNLTTFANGVRAQGLQLLVVELAFGDAPFTVDDNVADRVLRLRSDTVLWHKERLLNLGIRSLPDSCRHVAWVDGDILFENDQWVRETQDQLAQFHVVQPFERAVWLGAGERQASLDVPLGMAEGHYMQGFAAGLDGAADRRSRMMFYKGHTGFAWAARRDFVLEHGLYERAVLGGGDLINAHAFAADEDLFTRRTLFTRWMSEHERAAITRWGRPVADVTGGRMGWVPGRVLHLFHGALATRRYETRLQILKQHDFDPVTDIACDGDGTWRWNSDKPAMHQKVAEYFNSRALAARHLSHA